MRKNHKNKNIFLHDNKIFKLKELFMNLLDLTFGTIEFYYY